MKKIFNCCLLAYFFTYIIGYAEGVIEREIIIKEHKFYPETTKVPSGQKIRLTIKNEDNTIEEFDSIDLKREKIIARNSFVHIVLPPLKPGKYCYIGEFHPETAVGCIIVNDVKG